ncbi:MAG: carbon-nitrogen hydrolase family protein [Devosia nanyangense]|nr:carbon-nitrogen hydrolase family protein [Devosia nanyangense]
MRVVLTQPKTKANDQSNIRQIGRLLHKAGFVGDVHDAIVLPELVGEGATADEYVSDVSALAREFGCHVIGGSHFVTERGAIINRGVVVNADGEIIAQYSKANPYGAERVVSDAKGQGGVSFRIGDVECFAASCADFFHLETFQGLRARPEILFVPAFTVSRKSSPVMARARWRHAMVARAFEQAAFVAVSDWAHPVTGYGRYPSSGVAGLAHPDPSEPSDLLKLVGRRQVGIFDIDLEACRLLRADQRARGFEIARVREMQ